MALEWKPNETVPNTTGNDGFCDEPMDLSKDSLAHLTFESIVNRAISFSFDSPGTAAYFQSIASPKSPPLSWSNSTPIKSTRRRLSEDQDSGIHEFGTSESGGDFDGGNELSPSSPPDHGVDLLWKNGPTPTGPTRVRLPDITSPVLRNGAHVVSESREICSPPSTYAQMFPRARGRKRKLQDELDAQVEDNQDQRELRLRAAPWNRHGKGLNPLAMELPDPKKRYF